jgi:hypothetical protein
MAFSNYFLEEVVQSLPDAFAESALVEQASACEPLPWKDQNPQAEACSTKTNQMDRRELGTIHENV